MCIKGSTINAHTHFSVDDWQTAIGGGAVITIVKRQSDKFLATFHDTQRQSVETIHLTHILSTWIISLEAPECNERKVRGMLSGHAHTWNNGLNSHFKY